MTINIVCAVLLLLGGIATQVSPETWVLPSFVALLFPLFVVLNVVFVVYWLLRRKWNVVVSLFCLALVSGNIRNLVSLGRGDDEQGEKHFSLLTYNVHLFGLYKENADGGNDIVDYVLGKDADVVCLQEYGYHDKAGYVSQADLQRAFSKRYPYRYVDVTKNFKSGSRYGIATYSKYPIVGKGIVPYESEYNRSNYCDIVVGGDTVRVVNCHLESNQLTGNDRKVVLATIDSTNQQHLSEARDLLKNKLGRAAKIRARQAEIVAAFVDTSTVQKVVVCGDFNDHSTSYTYKTIRRGLVDAYTEECSEKGFGLTYNEAPYLFRIDYVLHSKNMRASHVEVDRVRLSDHYPVGLVISY